MTPNELRQRIRNLPGPHIPLHFAAEIACQALAASEQEVKRLKEGLSQLHQSAADRLAASERKCSDYADTLDSIRDQLNAAVGVDSTEWQPGDGTAELPELIQTVVGERDSAREALAEVRGIAKSNYQRAEQSEAACAAMREALELAHRFGSQGETFEGKSVSFFVEKALESTAGQQLLERLAKAEATIQSLRDSARMMDGFSRADKRRIKELEADLQRYQRIISAMAGDLLAELADRAAEPMAHDFMHNQFSVETASLQAELSQLKRGIWRLRGKRNDLPSDLLEWIYDLGAEE